MSAAPRNPLIEALTDPKAYRHEVTEIRLAETHISWVLLTGRYAYKVKKPLKLPFLDFSTLERRRYFCEQELELNRRLAAELYLAVVPIGGTLEQPEVEAEPAVEYAVKMRQFPDDALLDTRVRANAVPVRVLRDFAADLARFHARLPALTDEPDPEQTLREVADNLAELRELTRRSPFADAIAAVQAWTKEEWARIASAVATRLASDARKDCHGDLHLQNLLLLDGKIVAFDALEFDPRLREIDVASEASFPMMDLLAHHRSDLAYAFIAQYLETGGDYAGIEVLRFYLAYRAMVRAKVVAIKARQQAQQAQAGTLEPYFEIARELVAPRRPLLLITHGLSGSGKTHVTSELVARLPALRVRSDLERKREAGLDADAASGSTVGGGLYTADASATTYRRLRQIATTAIRNRFDIIVDATFLRRAERDAFAEVAAAHAARFAILDCVAATGTLRQRIAGRAAAADDASEATRAVLERQLQTHEPLAAEEQAAIVTVDTDKALDLGAVTAPLKGRA